MVDRVIIESVKLTNASVERVDYNKVHFNLSWWSLCYLFWLQKVVIIVCGFSWNSSSSLLFFRVLFTYCSRVLIMPILCISTILMNIRKRPLFWCHLILCLCHKNNMVPYGTIISGFVTRFRLALRCFKCGHRTWCATYLWILYKQQHHCTHNIYMFIYRLHMSA